MPKCQVCICSFKNSSSFKEHMVKIHNQKKPFKCETCDYVSAFNSNLINHIRTSHLKSMEVHLKNKKSRKERIHKKDFDCDLCSAKFTSEGGFRSHVKVVHEKRRFNCNL